MEVIEKKEIINGNQLNVYKSDEEDILFNAGEIANIIENKNVTQMIKNIDDEEKILITLPRANGGFIKQWYLNEDGVYEVLMQSRSVKAKLFKKEIKKIIKEVRVKGYYFKINENEDINSIAERVNSMIKELKDELEIKSLKLEKIENFLDEGKNYISLEFIANKYKMKKEDLISFLNEKRFLYKKGKNIYLYREHRYKGYQKYFKDKNKNNKIKFTNKGEFEISKIINNKLNIL